MIERLTIVTVDMAEVFSAHADEQRAWLAVDGPEGPVGVVHLSLDHDVAVLEHIFVLPEYRRRGIARRLIEQAQVDTGLTVAHDNRLSLLGSRFVKSARVGKLPYPFQRLRATEVGQSGMQLLAIASQRYMHSTQQRG